MSINASYSSVAPQTSQVPTKKEQLQIECSNLELLYDRMAIGGHSRYQQFKNPEEQATNTREKIYHWNVLESRGQLNFLKEIRGINFTINNPFTVTQIFQRIQAIQKEIQAIKS